MGTAEADADAYYGYGLAGGFAPAAGHSVEAPVKHACRSVTTEHCVDNPTVKVVPVEVEHCHVIKVDCTDVENLIPVTTCEAVTTTHVSEAAYAAPVVAHAPVAAYAGYAGHY